jgi:uncharacterized integral membrane protein
MKTYLPYIITILCSIITGLITYFSAIKKSKLESENEIKKMQE